LRQRADDDDAAIVRTFGLTYTDLEVSPPAVPRWHQLIYAVRGVVTVRAGEGAWVVPPHRAMWVPAGRAVTLETHGEVALRALYVHEDLSRDVPRTLAVVNVSPLLRELILRTVKLGALERAKPKHARLAAVIVDELEVLTAVPLQLPMPKDPRAARLARRLLDEPGDDAALARLVRVAGGSRRTLERLFAREVGMTLGQWRQRLRLLHALRGLAGGEAVSAVAAQVGYASASAFVAMFRRELGVTPRQYFREDAGRDAKAL
jgi:AraC-like DNA-binding protein